MMGFRGNYSQTGGKIRAMPKTRLSRPEQSRAQRAPSTRPRAAEPPNKQPPLAAGELQAGDAAPEFDLPATSGGRVSLRSMRGKAVVLYFYPKDDTSGCTKEACSFRDGIGEFRRRGAEILGVSMDSLDSHHKFAGKFSLPFALLSDEDGKTCRAYGVYRKKSMYGREYWGIERSTFVIDPQGHLAAVYRKVKVEGHDQEVLRALAALPTA
jgi:peroxiredoxin Q/BCP